MPFTSLTMNTAISTAPREAEIRERARGTSSGILTTWLLSRATSSRHFTPMRMCLHLALLMAPAIRTRCSRTIGAASPQSSSRQSTLGSKSPFEALTALASTSGPSCMLFASTNAVSVDDRRTHGLAARLHLLHVGRAPSAMLDQRSLPASQTSSQQGPAHCSLRALPSSSRTRSGGRPLRRKWPSTSVVQIIGPSGQCCIQAPRMRWDSGACPGGGEGAGSWCRWRHSSHAACGSSVNSNGLQRCSPGGPLQSGSADPRPMTNKWA
mmetsp:Transcript_16291/g.46499  ORF Transcript_16291/g.46499 Transcript_16291/m.46499 type:complete len:267 (+) Transcript_16291:1781-2581(+)